MRIELPSVTEVKVFRKNEFTRRYGDVLRDDPVYGGLRVVKKYKKKNRPSVVDAGDFARLREANPSDMIIVQLQTRQGPLGPPFSILDFSDDSLRKVAYRAGIKPDRILSRANNLRTTAKNSISENGALFLYQLVLSPSPLIIMTYQINHHPERTDDDEEADLSNLLRSLAL